MSAFTNPLTNHDSPDPAVVFHEGFYYAVTSSGKRAKDHMGKRCAGTRHTGKSRCRA